jgi:YD repeat-containing protein
MLAAWTTVDEQHVIKFRDGRRWTFDRDGWLIEQSRAPLTLTYQRDGQHRVKRIEGRIGAERRHIDLRYDERGRLVEAAASDGRKVTYGYEAAGLLAKVRRPDGLLEYHYRDNLVIEERRDGKTQRQFEYAEGGRLKTAADSDTGRVVYQVTGLADGGTRLTLTPADHPEQVETITYDARYRPLSVVSADGTRADWRYEETGAITFTMVKPASKPLTVRISADGRREETRLPSGVQYVRTFDQGGRPTELIRDGETLQRVEWRTDGQPRLIEEEGRAYRIQGYRENGLPSRVLITPPGKQDSFKDWVELSYDDSGRPTVLKESGGAYALLDSSGEVVEYSFDQAGTGKVMFDRDVNERVRAVRTSWGYQERHRHGADGGLEWTEIREGTATAEVEYQLGRPTRVRRFDGSEVRMAYDQEGPERGRLREVLLPGDVRLTYAYDGKGRLAEVACGGSFRLCYEWDEKGRLTGLKQKRGEP